jgi:hypothetical protein
VSVIKYEEPGISDEKVAYIAREIAMDILDIPQILQNCTLTTDEFDRIKTMPRFQRLLENEVAAWGTVLNTHERVKIKAAYNVEDWLLRAHQDMHNEREPLSSRVQVARLVTQLAGMGLTGASIEGGVAERFSVTINLGEDKQLKFEKQITPRVIEGEVVENKGDGNS